MQKTFIVVVALFGLISASSMFRAPVTEAIAPYSRNFSVPVSDKNTYLADMDYKTNETTSHKWLVSLYSSQQILPKDKTTCAIGFAKVVDCEGDLPNICKNVEGGQDTALTTPYFTGVGTPISTTLVGEYFSWQLQANAPAYNTKSCDATNVNTDLFAGAEGIWGLGFDGNAKGNFINNTKNFWISFSNSSTLNIAFSDALDVTGSFGGLIEKKFSVKTDANWRVAAKEVSFNKYKSADALATTQILFDINYKSNGFPKAIYDEIIKALNADDIKAVCDDKATEFAACTGKVKADKLKIEVNIDGTNKLTLTAYDLVQDYIVGKDEVENFKLNLRSLSAAATGSAHITADAEKTNPIIIGQRTLSYFTTVFNVQDSTVTQYYLNLEVLAKFAWAILKWIIIAIVGSIIVCCLCICFCCGGTAWIVAKLGKKDKQDNYYQSSQTDPFVARK